LSAIANAFLTSLMNWLIPVLLGIFLIFNEVILSNKDTVAVTDGSDAMHLVAHYEFGEGVFQL
jgi:hypothetical protein